MTNWWEPNTNDLRAIKRIIRPSAKKFEDVYRDIRNKVFAHTEVIGTGAISELFSRTSIGDIEDILYDLRDIMAVIFHLYQNGRRPERRDKQYDYKEKVSESTRTALTALLD